MKKLFAIFFTNLITKLKGKFMKELIGAVLIHLLIAILLGWFLINLIS